MKVAFLILAPVLAVVLWLISSTHRVDARAIGSTQPYTCKVTRPNGKKPPPYVPDGVNPTYDSIWTGQKIVTVNGIKQEGFNPTTFRDGFNHGNEYIWAGLPNDGTLRIYPGYGPPGDSLHLKFGWWRRSGTLTVTGRRLDASAPPMRRFRDGSGSYGTTGFQPSMLRFSSEGCWEITAKTDSAPQKPLTFVVRVVYEPHLP